jgi:hypothetical protein
MLITDLNKIKKLSEKNDRENWDFRAFLKAYDVDIEEMDSIVYNVYEQLKDKLWHSGDDVFGQYPWRATDGGNPLPEV